MNDKHDSPHTPATILLVEDEQELSVEIKQRRESNHLYSTPASGE